MGSRIIISIIICFLTLGLAFFIWVRNYKNRINITFALSMVSTAFWGLSESLMLTGNASDQIKFWGIFSYVFGLTIPFCFIFFTFYFPYQMRSLNEKIIIVIFLFYVIGIVLAFIPGGVVEQGILRDGHGDITLNTYGYLIWFLIFITFFTWSYFNLFYKFYHSSGFIRQQLQSLIIFTIFPVIIATIFSVIVPFFSGEFLGWIGVQSLLVLVLGIFYYFIFTGKKIYFR